MRIYEFAKQYSVTSKELIDLLKKEGFAVGNHMSVLSDQEIIFLNNKYSPASPSSLTKKSTSGENIQETKKETTPKPVKEKTAITHTDVIHKASFAEAVNPPLSAEKKVEKIPTIQTKPSLIIEAMTAMELANKINRPLSEVILHLLKSGIAVTKNQIISEETIIKIASQLGIEVIKKNNSKHASSKENQNTVGREAVEAVSDMTHERMPIVVVLGHVDHGKTTLLDFIRKTRVASREKGGITQHIGAYQASTKHGDIVFIDTPGHEAFSKIRQRGIRVADIAVIVVAADDGVMPQTVEAIKQALAMNVIIIVAINKMDRADNARLDIIKRQLTQYGLVPEDWGGDIICVPISAKTGAGVDKLLEMISLQSQMLELKTNPTVPGRGYILESKIERGRGVVATLISQHGTVALGDYFTCGSTGGHISSLFDSYGVACQKVGPSIPVQVGGFDTLPEVGDFFKVVSREEYRKAKNQESEVRPAFNRSTASAGALNLLVKTDSDSSKEALLESLDALSKKSELGLNIVFAGVGNVNESDVELAFNTNSQIISLHTKVQPNAISLAGQRKISILQFDIIYKLLEYLQERTAAQKTVPLVRKKIGQATVLRVFDIKGVGVIAGSIVNDGRFVKDGEVVAIRSGRKVGQGIIKSLQREKRTVKEVHTGFECGFIVDGFSEWQVDDIVECYTLEPDVKK